jgi:beta-galactosidase
VSDRQGAAPAATQTTRIRLDTDWLFGGEVPLPGTTDRLDPHVIADQSRDGVDDSNWSRVTVPHTVAPLSWEHWDPALWESVWVYRRHFDTPADLGDQRTFLDFDAVMTHAVVTVNETRVGEHIGGYLPFSFEVTGLLKPAGSNVVTVIVDSRFTINVPPNLPDPAKSTSIDYWQPGGIHRDVWLRVVPPTFIEGVDLTHHDELEPAKRGSSVVVRLNSATERVDIDVVLELFDAEGNGISSATVTLDRVVAGLSEAALELTHLEQVELWDTATPTLYRLVATISDAVGNMHSSTLRTGFREARFELDGFYLNGVRRFLFGVNRHGYFPFTAFAMPDRVHRRDAEIIKNELNCVMVRCSHYPQTASFLDACDELGLLVWEESPGWQFVGDAVWQDRAVDDITQMIARDRHRPSIIVWGARLNETPDRPEFYARTEALVKALDPTRATSGTTYGDYVASYTFQQDVLGYDDYDTAVDETGERRPILHPALTDRPYLVSEAISTRSSPTSLYRRSDTARVQQHQALDFAYANNDAMGDPLFTGLLAWVGFDYQAGMGNHYHGIKTAGLGDVFRILKPGAAIYRSQIAPSDRPVIEPAFTWDPTEFVGQAHIYGARPDDRFWGPGSRAMICSNLDRLDVYLGGELVDSVLPDRARFPHLPYAPSFVDLTLAGHSSRDLRIDGYLDGTVVASRSFAGDRASDHLRLAADDDVLAADGVDATRVTLQVVDRFGEPRGKSQARIELDVQGPGELIGPRLFELESTGAVGAVWIRSRSGAPGVITLRATSRFGIEAVQISTEAQSTTIGVANAD